MMTMLGSTRFLVLCVFAVVVPVTVGFTSSFGRPNIHNKKENFFVRQSSTRTSIPTTTTSITTTTTTLDRWNVLPNGRVQGTVTNHPSVKDGSIIETSPLMDVSSAQAQATVKTMTGSEYQLLTPSNDDYYHANDDENVSATVLQQQALYLATIENQNGKNESDKKEEQQQLNEVQKLMTQIKEAGIAGIIAFGLVQLAFWALSFPVCLVIFRQLTGHWPDLSNQSDLQELGAEAFAFYNVARLAAPLRIGAALGAIPYVQKNIVDPFTKSNNNQKINSSTSP